MDSSQEDESVNVVPPNAWNATAVTGSGAVYDGTGLDEDISWFGPIKVIATTAEAGAAVTE